MPRETVISNFKLMGREILSSYAAFTIEGVMTARVRRGKDSWTDLKRRTATTPRTRQLLPNQTQNYHL